MKKYIFTLLVLALFNDKENPGKVIKPGETLTTDDLARVNNIVRQGLGEIKSVEAVDENAKQNPGNAGNAGNAVSVLGTEYDLAKVKEALNAIGVKVAANAGLANVQKKVTDLTDEQANALTAKLSEPEAE